MEDQDRGTTALFVFLIFVAVSRAALETTYQKGRQFCVVGNMMSRYVFFLKKWYKEKFIQVNLMAYVREKLKLNNHYFHLAS